MWIKQLWNSNFFQLYTSTVNATNSELARTFILVESAKEHENLNNVQQSL